MYKKIKRSKSVANILILDEKSDARLQLMYEKFCNFKPSPCCFFLPLSNLSFENRSDCRTIIFRIEQQENAILNSGL